MNNFVAKTFQNKQTLIFVISTSRITPAMPTKFTAQVRMTSNEKHI